MRYNRFYTWDYHYNDESKRNLAVENFYIDEGIDQAPPERTTKTNKKKKKINNDYCPYLFANTKKHKQAFKVKRIIKKSKCRNLSLHLLF